MTSALPDDLVLEYDLLQFVENDSTLFTDQCLAPTSPGSLQVFNADDLLGNCSVGVDLATNDDTTYKGSHPQCNEEQDPVIQKESDKKEEPIHPSTAIEAGSDTDVGDDFSSFLIDGEEFLNEMEKVVRLEMGASPDIPHTPVHDSDLDFDCLTDNDIMSSPCPSSCQSTCLSDSPKKDINSQMNPQCLEKQQQAWLMAQTMLLEAEAKQSTSIPASPPSLLQHQSSSIDLTTSEDDVDEEEEVEDVEVMEIQDEKDDDITEQNDAELLEKEAKYLEAQVDYLVSRAKSTRPQRTSIKAKRRGRDQIKLLQPVVQDTKILNELVSQQQVYLDNFKAMLAFAPVNDVRLALMTPMETYIHLGRDFNDRRRTILAMREEKLDMTHKYIEHKAQGLNLNQPYQYSDMFEKFGKNYCVNFAISKYEGVHVKQVARAIYEQIAGKDEALANAMGCMTIRESYDSIQCNFMHQRIISSLKWNDEFLDDMPDMESNSIFYNRFDGNTAVLATDYIDQDDLHPYLASDRIRKDVSSGVVLTGHVDAEGKPYVIMKRFLMAKFHMYPHKISQEKRDKFFSKMPNMHDKMKSLIVDRIARNDFTPGTACCNGGSEAVHVPPQELPVQE